MARQRWAMEGGVLLGLLALAVPGRADEAAAVKMGEKLGGKVTRDDNRPGKHVVGVCLSCTRVTDAGLNLPLPDDVQVGVQVLVEGAWGRRLSPDHLENGVQRRLRLKRGTPGQLLLDCIAQVSKMGTTARSVGEGSCLAGALGLVSYSLSSHFAPAASAGIIGRTTWDGYWALW